MTAGFSDQFRHYLVPDTNAIKEAMTSGLIVFDTNVLLNAYRFGSPAREELLSLLSAVSDRTWIPYRVAEEFHRNRLTVAISWDDVYTPLLTELDKVQEQLEKSVVPKIAQLANRTALSDEGKERLTSLAKNCIGSTRSAVESLKKTHQHGIGTADPVLLEYQKLYSAKVGPPFTEPEFAEALTEAERRIVGKIPPGYCDKDKPEPFGDYFIWKQTLNEAARRKSPWLLFVTADTKEDWYQIIRGGTICARPELAQEGMAQANSRLVMLTLSSFLFHARQYLDADISGETIRESEQSEEASDAEELPDFILEAARGLITSRLLTREEETELAMQIRAGRRAEQELAEASGSLTTDARANLERLRQNGTLAWNRLRDANLQLVLVLAKGYSPDGVHLPELVHAGNIGLTRAIQKYDHTRGYRFSTFATWWIRHAIVRAARDLLGERDYPLAADDPLSDLDGDG
jgi:hypothetical protein